MKLSKIISAMILSFVLVLSSFAQANAKRLTAAVADWTGGEISCQVAVAMLEEEIGIQSKKSCISIRNRTLGSNRGR